MPARGLRRSAADRPPSSRIYVRTASVSSSGTCSLKRRRRLTERECGCVGAGVRHPRGMNSRLVRVEPPERGRPRPIDPGCDSTCRDPVAADGRHRKSSISSRRYEEDTPVHAHTPTTQSRSPQQTLRRAATKPGVTITISSETLRSISTARAALPEPRTVIRTQTHTSQPGRENDLDAISKGP